VGIYSSVSAPIALPTAFLSDREPHLEIESFAIRSDAAK
jgi:hypothetical protein